ncbi:FAD-dependent monooxygenase [Sciscionella marina]|uniref:FAD-dependent monooxygenase n=1 Tax=Sciscionella marina TaxID=508770 RepID=UPI00039EA829|nr:FAD-dependent monooxygenase [Sciscionella marina]
MDADVLIVGAGPVGLLLSAELRLGGAEVVVLERSAKPNEEKRARAIGPLAFEALCRRGLGPEIAEYTGIGLADLRHDHGSTLRHFAWIFKIEEEPGRAGAPIWQPDLERILREYARGLGVVVHWGTGVETVVQDSAGVTAGAAGTQWRARYLVGCDGGRSTVRGLAGFAFPGTEPTMITRVTEVDPEKLGELPEAGDYPGGKLMHGGTLLGTTEFGTGTDGPLTTEELRASIRRITGADVPITELREPRKFTDRAHQASTYRSGRVLIAGDAAHVHSPNGGQGLNLGLVDAANLGWKLASVIAGTKGEELLDSYPSERHPAGAAVLRNTRAQSALLWQGEHIGALRELLAELMDLPAANRYFWRLLTGTGDRYEFPYPASHPRTGFACGDLEPGGRPVAEYTEDGTALLALPRGTAVPVPERVRVLELAAPIEEDLSGVLIRPDGTIAWACAGEDTDGLAIALRTWFGG